MQLGRVGTDETGVAFAASFVPYAGILSVFIHGGEIEIPAGTMARAKLGADVPAPPAAALPAQGAQPASPANQGDHP